MKKSPAARPHSPMTTLGFDHLRGAHAPSHVVFGALAENRVEWPTTTPVFGEGAKANTRWRVCYPKNFHPLVASFKFQTS